MKKVLITILILSIVSCNSSKIQQSFKVRLNSLDSFLTVNPKVVLDSLNKIECKKLSPDNQAYFNLIMTIALDKTDYRFHDDSLISSALHWYENNTDINNYTRALAYDGIVRYSINIKDSLTFNRFKQAEKYYNEFKMHDNHLIGLVYSYLGKLNKSEKNYKEAEYYFDKCVDLNKYSTNNYIISLIDLIWVQINLKEQEKTLTNIAKLDDIDSIPEFMKSNTFNVKSGYYASIGDFKQAILFAKKNISASKDLSSRDNQFYAMSSYYLKLNMLDSAAFYGEMSVKAISDTLASSKYHLYKHLADVYKLKGDYKKASDTYYKAYEFHQQYLSEVSSKKILELEKRYNLETKEFQLSIIKQRNTMLIITIIGLSVIFVLFLFLLWFRIKITQRENLILIQKEEIRTQKIDAKQKKQKVINDFLKISTSLHPAFSDNYKKVISSNSKLSPDLYKELLKLNKDFNSEYRKNVNEIIDNELNELIDFLPQEIMNNLSSNEKVVLFLTNEEYTTAQIAEILNTTSNSVRTSRMRLIQKLLNSGEPTPEIRSLLGLLNSN